jgi:hypothetical protein
MLQYKTQARNASPKAAAIMFYSALLLVGRLDTVLHCHIASVQQCAYIDNTIHNMM